MHEITCQETASLNRSLHDLKQSEWKWAGLLVETVVEYDMEQCRTDPCVFRMVVVLRRFFMDPRVSREGLGVTIEGGKTNKTRR